MFSSCESQVTENEYEVENEHEVNVENKIDDIELDERIEEYMKEVLNQYESLPTIYVDEEAATAEEAKRVFQCINEDERFEDVKSADTEDTEETAYMHKSWNWGKIPFFDCSFDYTFAENQLGVNYRSKDFYYVDTVLDLEPESVLSEFQNDNISLDYDIPKNVEMSVQAVLQETGVAAAFVDEKCFILSAQILQNLYDKKSKNGTLRSQRWGDIEEGPYKVYSDMAKKEKWTEEDTCYYLSLSQEIHHLPIESTSITVLTGEKGIIYFSMRNGIPAYTEKNTAELLSYSELMEVLSRILENIYTDGKIEVSDLALNYNLTDSDAGIYQPVWKVSIAYDFINGDGEIEARTSHVLINAFTGEQIVVEEK